MLRIPLPGGVRRSRGVHRQAHLRVLSGRVERDIASCLGEDRNPGAVSHAVARAVARIDDLSVDSQVARELSVADRQVLMLAVGAQLGGDQVWLRSTCGHCGADYDVGYRRSEVPVANAGPGYPFTEVALPSGAFRLRVPTGGDQEALFDCSDDEAAEALLLRRCVLTVIRHDTPVDVDEALACLPTQDRERLEAELDAVSPAVAATITTRCAECGAKQMVPLDPYDVWGGDPLAGPRALDEEVHRIAACYHWSEREILSLPRQQRLRYLALIDRHLGLHG